jgi:undecaprenyl-diphosphatase
MEDLNRHLFLLLDASNAPPTTVLWFARALAEGFIWLVPAGLALGWLRGSTDMRESLVRAASAGALGLLINQLIGLAWYHPRPFAMGVGHTWLAHVADTSFPSDHLTLIFGIAFSLLCHSDTRRLGRALALAGLPVAWARIYLGVHFPFDMVGAAAVALASATAVQVAGREVAQFLVRRATPLHQLLFAPMIERGWVRK